MSYFNEDQEAHMAYLATVPRERRCASGWHVIARENCNCGPYEPCAIKGCARSRHRDSALYCYEDMKRLGPKEVTP
jgi:pentatricopeptide repeat protein